MDCLWCDQALIPEVNWSNLLFSTKPKTQCVSCESKLEVLSGKRCRRCSRSSLEAVCPDCVSWEEHAETEDLLTNNFSVFAYNLRMREIVAKWKYRGDYCLGNIFKTSFKQSFDNNFSNLSKNTLVVPIPLSSERLMERGFNQAQMLADFLPVENQTLLTRVDGEKQSKKTRKERLLTKNPFELLEKVNKSVILVDDIYTTGTTLRHAAALLKENGCPQVYAYTLIRG